MKRREGREMALAEGVRPGRITRDSERALAPATLFDLRTGSSGELAA